MQTLTLISYNKKIILIALLSFFLTALINCDRKSSIDGFETIPIDNQKVFKGISIIPQFHKQFEVILSAEVTPYKDGIAILRNHRRFAYITALDFDGNVLIEDKQYSFDRQAPDRLSYGALFYEPHTNKLWNILYPYVKKFDLHNLAVTASYKMPSNSTVCNTSKYLIPRPIVFSSGETRYWTYSDKSKDYYYIWGIARTKLDLSGEKILFQFERKVAPWYQKGVKNRVIEVDGYDRQTHDRFPFTVDTSNGTIFFSRDIWKPEMLRISSTGQITQFTLNTNPTKPSTFNNEDLETEYKLRLENFPNDLRTLYKLKKKEILHNPYILDMMVYHSFLIVITPSYSGFKRERIAYVLDKKDLSFLGNITVPSYGNTIDYFITGNYLVEHAIIMTDETFFHSLSTWKIVTNG